MTLYEIVCRYRKTIAMNSIYKWKKLTSTYSGSYTELSSLYEDETTCIRQDACADELTSVIIEKQSENQNTYNEEEQHCSDNFEYCGKNEQQSDLWLNQRVLTKSPTSETKDLLDTQPRNPSAELQETLIESQDYIQNDQESSSMVSNDGNLDEYLQRFTIEQVPEIRGQTASKVSDNQTIEKMIALNKELQNSLKKDIKGVHKGLQKVYQKFDCFCSLISDLLKYYILKSTPNLLNRA